MNNKNIIIVVIIVALILGAGGFYGGMIYGKSKNSRSTVGQFGSGQRQNGQGAGMTVRRGSGGAGFVNGEIIGKDDKSITVKSADGGSKIIFLSASTQVTKSASGTISDLVDNTQVMINGTTNPDGSITAGFIQIRPQTFGQNHQDAPGDPATKGKSL